MTRIARNIAVTCWALVPLWLWTPAAAQTPLLEVEKSDATKLMQVNDDAGFVARGARGIGTIPAAGPGSRLMWYPAKAAFRAGFVHATQWDDANIGGSSVAMGDRTTASGVGSTAMGMNTTASGAASTAMGFQTMASGASSTAIGSDANASGLRSIAMGSAVSAIGINSIAMGSYAAANGAGSFVYGDNSTTAIVEALFPNQFTVRAAGGTAFFSNPTLTAGVFLAAGGGAWQTVSDARRKRHFRAESGEAVLAKLATLPIPSWSYRAQDASVRHLGPTAQDFHAAFGLGESDTTITTTDADGVALLAVQALERRTAELREENAKLRQRLDALEAERVATRK